MKARFYLPLAGLALLAAFFVYGLYFNEPREIPSPLIGKPAPAFSLPDVLDPQRQVSSENYRGKPYLVNVWATWCFACRDEHEVLVDIARSNVVPIVGLDWKDDRAMAVGWLKQLGNPYREVAFDAEGRVAINWGVYGAPETFLISADNHVLHKHVGALTPEVWREDFLPKLEAAGAAQ